MIKEWDWGGTVRSVAFSCPVCKAWFTLAMYMSCYASYEMWPRSKPSATWQILELHLSQIAGVSRLHRWAHDAIAHVLG